MGGHGIAFGHYPNFIIKHASSGRWAAKLGMAGVWFFILHRCKEEGGHHFLGHHAWDDPNVVKYLEQVDKKYGSTLAVDNMHHH